MAKLIGDLRPVYVVGIGLHPYQYPTETPYIELGLTAIRRALADANIPWEAVESSYIAHALLGMAAGRQMLKYLGALGKPLAHVENASASGSTAVRHAAVEVAAGISDVALAVGLDKFPTRPIGRRASSGLPNLAEDAIVPFTHFALLADEYSQKYGVKQEDIAQVAVKNHANGALNPNAQRQRERTLEEVLARPISGFLTALQCTPRGEGAAAVIIASEEGIKRLGIDATRAVRIASSAAGSEEAGNDLNPDTALSAATMSRAMREAGVAPREIDVIEVHDAFTVEELLYAEATGICDPGQYIPLLKEGAWNIGGKCAISPSGGLIAMGHPIGPTGVGQVAEIAAQLRGEAGPRQHRNAKVGLAHMVGVGAVCYVHVLKK
ncbi:thiolase family protein [Bradyrhizobium sp. BR13661]|jgi:acetyl-CoA acetyltransferase|uniref:thiolase family protein n=1 Tax=Bradyrhizobium sp. BR13661 TaxID=2940622 RepID=UPI002476DCCC|nr:thiolase family protein [Bradyrhizobium sp. BR13661]MDH6260535.1 acetyl-CoA acetyltransferase [Bradyrhizobium sp. BR13661]